MRSLRVWYVEQSILFWKAFLEEDPGVQIVLENVLEEDPQWLLDIVKCVGEMGICNTKTSSATLSVLLDANVEAVTGRGGGITDDSFRKKKEVIQRAIAVNQPDKNDVIDVLAKVGGFDIAAMCGAFIGAALIRRTAVIDGFISAVAALCAVRLCPNVKGYLVPSHASYEIGYKLAMDTMELQPIFLLGMRLGEGSGCPLAFQVLEAACTIINDMATFAVIGIVLLTIAQFAFFASAPEAANYLILIFVPAVSRCCSALAVTGLKPMSTSQYADQKKPKVHMIVLTVMLFICLGAGFLLCGKYGFALVGCLVGYGLALLRAYKSLDGMNGDISGYALTIGELCAIAAYALI